MTRQRRLSSAEKAQTRALVEVLEPRSTLWQRMSHQEGTCGGRQAGCPVCQAPSSTPTEGTT